MGDRQRTLKIAREIDNMPIKVPSTEVDNIKLETKNILTQFGDN
jgi:hypothetical protein